MKTAVLEKTEISIADEELVFLVEIFLLKKKR
jgi:hypothetical protein